jgi:hypothetical protein
MLPHEVEGDIEQKGLVEPDKIGCLYQICPVSGVQSAGTISAE